MIAPLPGKLEQSLRRNPAISAVLSNWSELSLPNCWLVAGSVVQSYWNAVHGYSPLHGVSDIDIIYFEANDLSEASESDHALRIADKFRDSPTKFDVKNEAGVHLWYEGRFGHPIKPYISAEAAIDTFPTTAGAIGIRPKGNKIQCYASFGYDDLMRLIVRPNKRQIRREIYVGKVARWKSVWPMLNIIDWDDA